MCLDMLSLKVGNDLMSSGISGGGDEGLLPRGNPPYVPDKEGVGYWLPSHMGMGVTSLLRLLSRHRSVAVAVGLFVSCITWAEDPAATSGSTAQAVAADAVPKDANQTPASPDLGMDEESKAVVTNEPDYSMEAVLQRLREHTAAANKKIAERESRYRQGLEESQQRLARANAQLQAEEDKGRQLEGDFESNRVELDDKAKLLKDKLGALKELFGVFQQNASDLIGSFNGSATSIQFPKRDEWLEGFANRMKVASEVSSVDDIMGLWFEMQREITSTSNIVRLYAPVMGADGEVSERELVRIGGFNLISSEPQPAYLVWSDAGQETIELKRQPDQYLSQIDSYMTAGEGLHTVAVDPTGGALVALLVQKPTLVERIHQGGLVGYMILALGLFALLLAAYKLFDIATISLRVQTQQRDIAQPNTNNVLGQLLQVYQSNRHVDSEALEMRLHEAVQKGALRVNRFAVFLAIIAAVAPLLGLLGTVVGMINTFQAITLYGTGDPQTMAGGISQALITTVLGLVVAVPAVLLHAVVSGRAKGVINILHQQSAALTGDQIQHEHQARASTADSPGVGSQTAPSPA